MVELNFIISYFNASQYGFHFTFIVYLYYYITMFKIFTTVEYLWKTL